MKKIAIKSLSVISIITFILFACESQDDSYKDLINQGESVIVGGAEDITVSKGVGRIKLGVTISSDPKIKTIEVSENGTVVEAVDVNRTETKKEVITVDLMNLTEGLHNFTIKILDGNGNSSLASDVSTTVNGQKYIENLSTRKVNSVSFNTGTLATEISWGDPLERMQETRLTYTSTDGEEKTILVSNFEIRTIVSDFTPDSMFSVVSNFYPSLQSTETAFEDFLSLEVIEGDFPVCNTLSNVILSVPSFDFGQLNKDESSTVESFTIQSSECIDGAVTLNTAEPFGVSLDPAGPFETSIELADISTAQTVYTQFTPVSGRNQVYNGSIDVAISNLENPASVSLSGEEIGNVKSGLHILGPDEAPDFSTIVLPNDALWNAWGGEFHVALFDGSTGTHAHSSADEIPAHFTIDLGKDYAIKKVGWKGRSGFDSRSLKRYQVWGLSGSADVNAAATSTGLTPATESDWSIEMAMNGWSSLVDASLTDNPGVSGTTHDVSGFVYVRYIRVAVFETFSGESFFNFGELELTADFDID